MNLKKSALPISLMLALLPIIGHAAACTRADFTGTWRIYFPEGNSAGRCTLIMPKTGTTISTSSSCYLPGVVTSTPLRGNLTLFTDCHVTGTVTEGGQKSTIDAYISRGKDSISGMGWSGLEGGPFSGVRQ